MAQATLEEVTRLADQLSPDEQRALVQHLTNRPQLSEAREPDDALPHQEAPPRSLRGLWKGRFPEDFDIDAALHEIRHEWEKEWPELFEP